MRIKRTLPPAAAPITITDILKGVNGLFKGQTEVEHFKTAIKNGFQVKHCFLLSSGKAALTVILQALQRLHPDRDEVLIPAFTCYSVPSAIVRAGLKVRLCDVDTSTLGFDFTGLQESLKKGDNLLAVVCPHLFGLPADIAKIRSLSDNSQIAVIEDTAQAMGGVAKEKYLGTQGDAGFFSLGRGKVFSTVEGGVIVTNSDQLAKGFQSSAQKLSASTTANKLAFIIYALALSVLTHPSLFWIPKSLPGLKLGETIYDPGFSMKRFSSFQAGLARSWRKRISSFQTIRKQNVLHWLKALDRFPWLNPISISSESKTEALPLLRLPVLVQNIFLRDAVLEISDKHGLGIMPSYPDSIDKINELSLDKNNQTFPGAAECACRLVTFPVHGYVSSHDRRKIIT